MSTLNRQQREFVALGAALASNCVPCITYHIAEARNAGISAAQIRQAVDLADTVRKVPADQVLSTALAQLDGAGRPATPPDGCAGNCGC